MDFEYERKCFRVFTNAGTRSGIQTQSADSTVSYDGIVDGRSVQSSAVTSMFGVVVVVVVVVVDFQSFNVASTFPCIVFNVYGKSVRTT